MPKKTVSVKQRFIMVAKSHLIYHQSQNDIVALHSPVYKGFSKGSVNTIVGLINDQGWSDLKEIEALEDSFLEELLRPKLNKDRNVKPLPNFQEIHDYLLSDSRRTLFLYWRKRYCPLYETPYSYQRFCELYRRWCREKGKAPVMAFYNEPPGENWYIDWMGDTLDFCFDGELHTVYFFCTTLGISGYPYMEGFLDMRTDSFIMGHINALSHYGGVPKYAIPDNTRSAVIKNYEKEITFNRIYEDMQEHYGYVVLPARVKEPTDKSSVENTIGWFERQILMEIEGKTYPQLRDLNQDILEKLKELCALKYRSKEGTRQQWFEEYDRPLLRPLPQERFEVFRYDSAKVPDNYHVCIKEDKQHYYSVPYTLLGQIVIIKYSFTTILIEDINGNFITRHERSYSKTMRYITIDEHMPVNHRIGMENKKVRDTAWYLSQASLIGDNVHELVRQIIMKQRHPEQGYRSCMGIIGYHISHAYTDAQIDRVCGEALRLKQYSYGFVKRRLSELNKETKEDHQNIRGPKEFE